MSREDLKRYGSVFSFEQLDESCIPKVSKEGKRVKPVFIIRESSSDGFLKYIIDSYSPVEVPKSALTEEVLFAEIDFESKLEYGIKCRLCINKHHFIPYTIHKQDILYFFKPNNKKPNMYPFVFIKDQAIDEMLNAEHGIYGMIDMSKGSSLLSESDINVRRKMQEFQEKISDIGNKYQAFTLITIGDSVLLKHCFKILKNERLDFSGFNFVKIIECYREIKQSIKSIFNMDSYGVFTYGNNKVGDLVSYAKNVFHSGIFSKSFKTLIYLEERIKGSSKNDLYLTKSLYQTYRFYEREQFETTGTIKEHSAVELGIQLNHPDTSALDNDLEISEGTAVQLADTPFLIEDKKITF